MLSGTLWPAHPHPLPGESLSCLIVRTAHANGLKVQTFCDQVFGKEFQVWNRDIDRNAPDWLLNLISGKSGTPIKQIKNTTFRLYEKRLYPILHRASHLCWVMPIKHHHRLNTGYAIQYCPQCLAEDETPYFRLSWRLALYTFCPKHRVMMADRCLHCGAPVAFHRIELGKPKRTDVNSLNCCWQCEKKLSSIVTSPIMITPKLVDRRWSRILQSIDRQLYPAGALNYMNLALLHQFCRLMGSRKYGYQLIQYVSKKGIYPLINSPLLKLTFEQRSIQERHSLLQAAFWLISHKRKIKRLIKERVIPTNVLYRDANYQLKGYIDTLMFKC
ncbi:TniQ family protein [Aeromonas veronii]|uniref:TniQ family protein n=1 Tax=Aeromonas veronii TaxID=654 RepID=UPI0035BA3318